MSKRRPPAGDHEETRPETGGETGSGESGESRPGGTGEGASPVAGFERQLAQLERIVEELETGELGLEAALGRFEAGVGLLRQCQATLTAAERQIELLTGLQPDGSPRTEPFSEPG